MATPTHYNLIAIGTGPGSGGIPAKAIKAGMSVAVVEERAVGGTCALRGCTPKKLLIAAPEAYDFARRMNQNGLDAPNVKLDWPMMRRYKDAFIDKIPPINTHQYTSKGIELLRGHATFVGENTLEIEGKQYSADHVVLATGATPAAIEFPGSEHLLLSDDFFNVPELKGHVVFIGAGYISMEFAHVAARVGCKVTVIHRSDKPLRGFDRDLVEKLLVISRKQGINVVKNTEVKTLTKTPLGFRIVTTNPDVEPFDCDVVFHGAGRDAKIQDLNLEAANVAHSKKGIAVKPTLQSTTNPHVWAVGDCADNNAPALTSVAALDSLIVADQLFGEKKLTSNYSGAPTAAFTIPQLCGVGLTEEEAKAQGIDYGVNFSDATKNYLSYRVNGDALMHKVLFDKKTDLIIGAHALDYEASEWINVFAMAIRFGITATQIKHSLFAYPSHGAAIRGMMNY
ncbi:MAG: dihydrolipoyl dehydrogenase family protein [Sumerlaeia bacterium]